MSLASIPYLGAGLGFRGELADLTLAARHEIDFVEVVADRYFRGSGTFAELRKVVETFPAIPHGVGLSITTAGPIDADYLRQIKRISDITRSPYYSDHLCLTRVPGIDLGQLGPAWSTGEILRTTIDRVNAVQDLLGKPLVLENVSYLVEIPDSDPDFVHRLTEATGCGILLDVTNVYTNAVNHGFDPAEYLLRLPLDRVVQVHLAGGFWHQGYLADSHSHVVPDQVWNLFTLLCGQVELKAALLEFDQNFPDFRVILDQVATAREIMSVYTKRINR